MTPTLSAKPAILSRLNALLHASPMSPKVRQDSAELIDRLNAPVRIGVFGLPGTGKRQLLNTLSGAEIIAPGMVAPALEVAAGPEGYTMAVFDDGSQIETIGMPNPTLLGEDPVFLQIEHPSPQLEGRQILLLGADVDERDLAEGLEWAAPRVDLAVWCTRTWTEPERAIWQAAPSRLRDHAMLIYVNKGAARRTAVPPPLFSEAHIADPDALPGSASSFTDFSARLNGIIEDARLHDVLAAEIFLARYAQDEDPGDTPPAEPTEPPADGMTASCAALPEDTASPATAPAGEDTKPEPADLPWNASVTAAILPEDAASQVSRLFQFVRVASEDLRQSLRIGAMDDQAMLLRIERILDDLLEQSEEAEHMHDACPELEDLFLEARDLAVLLRMEGGADQAVDAAALLLQIRQDIERRLAA